MQLAPSYEHVVPAASAALVHASPAGTVARVGAHSEGFGGTAGGVLGHSGLFAYVIGIAQRVPEQTRTMLQSGLKSAPYSQRSPSFEHAFWSPGSVSGQAGLFVLVPPPSPELEPPPVAVPDAVFPEHAFAARPAAPRRRRAKARRTGERWLASMGAHDQATCLDETSRKPPFCADRGESGCAAV